MNRQRGSLPVIVIILIGCLTAAAVFWFKPEPKTRPQPKPVLPQVSVIEAILERHQVTVNTQGTVSPSRSIDIVSQVSGQLTQVSDNFANGAFFTEGEALAVLDDRDYQYRVTEAGAQVAAARRELALEEGQARQAKRQWRDLGSSDANDLFLRKPQVAAAQAQLAAAIAQQRQAQLNLDRTTIRPPFDGRIESTAVNKGQYVTAGTVIARVYDSRLAEVRLPLTNHQVALIGLPLGANLQSQQQVDVMLSANVAGQIYQWPAKLVRTEASIDSRTRFYFGVVEIPEPFDDSRYQAPLIMGLFVEATVSGLFFDDVVRLPEKAIINESALFIVDADNRLRLQDVTVMSEQQGSVWVRGNINTGDRIVVSNPGVLRKNMQVEPQVMTDKPEK